MASLAPSVVCFGFASTHYHSLLLSPYSPSSRNVWLIVLFFVFHMIILGQVALYIPTLHLTSHCLSICPSLSARANTTVTPSQEALGFTEYSWVLPLAEFISPLVGDITPTDYLYCSHGSNPCFYMTTSQSRA